MESVPPIRNLVLQRLSNAGAHLGCSRLGECDHQNIFEGAAVFDEPQTTLHHRAGLASARTRRHENVALCGDSEFLSVSEGAHATSFVLRGGTLMPGSFDSRNFFGTGLSARYGSTHGSNRQMLLNSQRRH